MQTRGMFAASWGVHGGKKSIATGQHDVNVRLAGQATGNARGPLRGLIESQHTDLTQQTTAFVGLVFCDSGGFEYSDNQRRLRR